MKGRSFVSHADTGCERHHARSDRFGQFVGIHAQIVSSGPYSWSVACSDFRYFSASSPHLFAWLSIRSDQISILPPSQRLCQAEVGTFANICYEHRKPASLPSAPPAYKDVSLTYRPASQNESEPHLSIYLSIAGHWESNIARKLYILEQEWKRMERILSPSRRPTCLRG